MKRYATASKYGLVLLLFCVVFLGACAKSQDQSEMIPRDLYTVSHDDFDVYASHDGKLNASVFESVKALDGLYVESVTKQVGDAVSAGDIIAVFDKQIIREQQILALDSLESLVKTMPESKSTKTVTAPVKGRVKRISASKGESVQSAMYNYGYLALLSTDGYMRIDIATQEEIELGQKVSVAWASGQKRGHVISKQPSGYRILLQDANVPYEEAAEVFVDGQSLGTGVLEINEPLKVIGTAGVVDSVRVKVEESVHQGGTIFKIIYSDEDSGFSKTLLDYTTLVDRYQRLLDLYENPSLIAPYDGVISELSINPDTYTGNTESCTQEIVVCKIATDGCTHFTVEVSSTEIVNLSPGQSVSITFDSLKSEMFEGVISRINLIGRQQNNTTVYAVEISVNLDKRLLEGMEGTARILERHLSDVVTIPMSYISEDNGDLSVNVVHDDIVQKQIISISDSDGRKAVIIDGLQPGDIICMLDAPAE